MSSMRLSRSSDCDTDPGDPMVISATSAPSDNWYNTDPAYERERAGCPMPDDDFPVRPAPQRTRGEGVF